jgi:hypothetical protein
MADFEQYGPVMIGVMIGLFLYGALVVSNEASLFDLTTSLALGE